VVNPLIDPEFLRLYQVRDATMCWWCGSPATTREQRLLRQYFPKGTDLSAHSPQRLLEVATELNDRPRKTLGGITPAQAMQRLLLDPESPVVATTA